MFRRFLLLVFFWSLSPLAGLAQETPATPPPAGPDLATQAVAAQAVQQQAGVEPRDDLLEHLVDSVLELFDVRTSGNTVTHYVIAVSFLALGILLRRVVTSVVFLQLRKISARTRATFDEKLITALEAPCSTAVMLIGLFAALKVLKLSPEADQAIRYGSTVAFSLVIMWGVLRAFNAVLDHMYEVAVQRELSVAAFMPWIKKTLIAVFSVVGVLMVVQSLGYDVKALLAGLGIGGLAFALAAQDTIANLFGSVVVAIDQPFKAGEFVRIGANDGVVEDIGLRSTKLRRADKSLVIVPNKTVAAEAITNLSRLTQRRVEQVIGLTYATTSEKMAAIVAQIRSIIVSEAEVDPTSVNVYFRDYSASSLDIWMVYNTKSPDFAKMMALRQRINLAIMRAVEAQGLSFAFPTQTIQLEGEVARQLAAGRRNGGPAGDDRSA